MRASNILVFDKKLIPLSKDLPYPSARRDSSTIGLPAEHNKNLKSKFLKLHFKYTFKADKLANERTLLTPLEPDYIDIAKIKESKNL